MKSTRSNDGANKTVAPYGIDSDGVSNINAVRDLFRNRTDDDWRDLLKDAAGRNVRLQKLRRLLEAMAMEFEKFTDGDSTRVVARNQSELPLVRKKYRRKQNKS